MNTIQQDIQYRAYWLRRWSIIISAQAGSGHPTSCLSAADIVAVLFFYAMNYNSNEYENPDNDRFVLSKGHASALLYAVWHQLGKISDEQMLAYRQYGSPLEGHPTRRCLYVEAATGSLGIGLSIGIGIALNARLEEKKYRTYVLLGDGELAEGSVWEAAQLASYYALNNLVACVDVNRLGQTGQTMLGHDIEVYAQRFIAFGWQVYVVNGHAVVDLMRACDDAKMINDKPTVILASTYKGCGVPSVEDKNGYHGKTLDLNTALEQLANSYPVQASQVMPSPLLSVNDEKTFLIEAKNEWIMPQVIYQMSEIVATRKAYGEALTALGSVCSEVIVLDAEVKNSTYTQLFEDKYSDRFIECFVAEQNMVGVAIGLSRRGKITFISTFSAFLTRAHDQIRMAAISQLPLRISGSHCGISIGQDGPSQMGLEDIAMMRALPESVVLYPADAVSTYALVAQMACYTDGISYLRTTRAETPVLYSAHEKFPIGGCKVLRSSASAKACVVAAGITLIEALKAHDILAQEGIAVAVIDLYSIKPLDRETIYRVAKASSSRIITVEDHYIQGGIADAVTVALRNTCIEILPLAVTGLPRSGDMQALLAVAGIDATAIVRAVKLRDW